MAGARVEAQLQLTIASRSGSRGTVFLLLGMVAWVAAGFVGAVIAAGLLGIGSVLSRIVLGLGSIPAPDQLVYVLVGASGFQGTLLFGALWQARRTGGGDRVAGLGLMAIRRRMLVALLCAVMIAWLLCILQLVAAFPALRDFAKSVMPDLLSGTEDRGPGVVILKVGLLAILAPVSEELFFRGWLWEALRQRGYAIVMTAGLTAIPWLSLHGIDAPGRILFLIPAAVIFSLARYAGGSVLGSLAAHVTNNSAAVLMQVISGLKS